MELFILGGFLGSGKTTLLNKMLRGLAANGHTVAVIENEIGDTGIDQALINDSAMTVTPLFGGCVCCQITGDLMSSILQISEEIKPDYLLIEMTGLAYIDRIRKILDTSSKFTFKFNIISVVDGPRWDRLFRTMAQLLTGQISGANLVVVNKVDPENPPENVINQVAKIAQHDNIRVINVEKESAEEIYNTLKEVLK